jgi:hypothetical protein
LDVEHPIAGDELRAIKRYMASRPDALPWLFISERGQTVHASISELSHRRGGRACRVAASTSAHAAALCGFSLANRGYGLRLIQDDPRLPWACVERLATKLLPFWSVGHF